MRHARVGKLENMKALVTGGTGFIGSCVVDLLAEQGHSVRLFSRKPALPERFAGKDISLFAGDLRNPESLLEAMDGMEVFYHIGEIKNTSPVAAKRNVDLMEQVIGLLGPAGIRRIVFISSLTVAGIPAKTPADEGTATAIALGDHYTRYKERCEKLLAEKAAGVEYAVIRPGVVYGPGSRYLGGLIAGIEKLGTFGVPFIGRGAAVAPLIYVKDLARAVYLAGTERDAAGQVCNLTDGLNGSWADFIHDVAAALGTKARILPVPPFLLGVPSKFIDLFSGLFGATLSLNAFVKYITTDLLFDNGKAQRILRWKAGYTRSQGVEEMVREYRKK
jgi:nucleoside-diphosphate-sugar epimerase